MYGIVLALIKVHGYMINPGCACAARVTVVGSVCLYVCLCVCVSVSVNISPLERLFILKLMPRTQRATKVKKIVGISLKLLCSEFQHFLHCTAILRRPFFAMWKNAHALPPRVHVVNGRGPLIHSLAGGVAPQGYTYTPGGCTLVLSLAL